MAPQSGSGTRSFAAHAQRRTRRFEHVRFVFRFDRRLQASTLVFEQLPVLRLAARAVVQFLDAPPSCLPHLIALARILEKSVNRGCESSSLARARLNQDAGGAIH